MFTAVQCTVFNVKWVDILKVLCEYLALTDGQKYIYPLMKILYL